MVKGNYNNALNDYNNELVHNGDVYSAHIGLGDVCYCQKNYCLAICKYKEAIRFNESLPEAYVRCGDAYLKINNTACAIENLKKAITIDEKCTKAHELLQKAELLCKNKSEKITVNELENAGQQVKVGCFSHNGTKKLSCCCKKSYM